jgi:hypothetical protein
VAGLRVRAIPLRTYDFSNQVVGTSQTLVVAQRIDISQYIDCTVEARVHSASGLSASNTLAFDVYGDGYTTDDPGIKFLTASPFFTSSVLTSGAILKSYGGTVRGPLASLVLTSVKGTAGAMIGTVSVDLILRSPDNV